MSRPDHGNHSEEEHTHLFEEGLVKKISTSSRLTGTDRKSRTGQSWMAVKKKWRPVRERLPLVDRVFHLHPTVYLFLLVTAEGTRCWADSWDIK